MSDIVIKIPKKVAEVTLKEYIEASDKGMELNYKVPFFPKKAEKGDLCYFAVGNEIKGWHIIKRFAEDEFTCEITGKKWKGKFIIRDGNTLHKCKSLPVPFKLGRSFTYVETTTAKLMSGEEVPVLRRVK